MVRMQAELGLGEQEVEMIQSIIESHFSILRACLMNMLFLCICLVILGILIMAGGSNGRECGPYNCTLGAFVALAPWALYAIFAIAYSCCILEAKNEKASSDLNLAFQNHPLMLHFKLTQTMHHTGHSYHHDGSSYTRHILQVFYGRSR